MLSSGKLGFWGLTALVFGLMVGTGIYNLPQNMAHVANPGAVWLSWLVTSIGILPLVIAFKWLSDRFPQYNAGIYQYALAGFGRFAGFNIAWGYWLCTAFSNIAYAVMLNDSIGAFFPVLLQHGWEMVAFGSVFIWLMFFIVSRGIQTAKFVNNLLAAVKVLMLILIITILVIFFKSRLYEADVWGAVAGVGVTWQQVKETMMLTLFCFFGVEGAVMMSARAKKPSDVGKAGIAGFLISLALYMCVSLLSYGLLGRAQLAELPDPSIAYILRETCGAWAYWFVICAVIVSLLGGWVAWTLVVAQVPYEASIVGILPKYFSKVNRHNMPTYGLFASSIVMNLFLLMVAMADDVYLTALHITGLMIIPGYFFTGLFLIKKADNRKIMTVAVITSVFCIWMAYSGGLLNMFLTSLFYMIGFGFYIRTHKERQAPGTPLFTNGEKWAFTALCASSLASLYIIVSELIHTLP